ncbi:hypothetical protein HPB51_028272 [Rhipicephalus microplus]|uniref:Uncharacterized protein n=1 Tax=Rhipicephalus microplus TaxID=6941 RepID=A0A9J6CXE2_RHIMP|nr:hypothetical protein HPB51_028272 [Rhipicephalus microplus]
MCDRGRRPPLVSHSDGPRPWRRLFRGRRKRPPPMFDGLMSAAYLQELFGLPSTYPWTPGPTLPTEPEPYYYIQWPYPVFPMFPLLTPWMVPAMSCEVAPNQHTWRPGASPDVARNGAPPRQPERQVVKRRGLQPPAEQCTEVVRLRLPGHGLVKVPLLQRASHREATRRRESNTSSDCCALWQTSGSACPPRKRSHGAPHVSSSTAPRC